MMLTDITVKGLEVVRKAPRVYLEAYTSILTVWGGGTGRICVNILNYRAFPFHSTFSWFLPRIITSLVRKVPSITLC